MNKGGQKTGLREDRTPFPYKPRVIGGKLVMPSEIQRIPRTTLDTAEVEIISDEMRAVVESLLAHKLPHPAQLEMALKLRPTPRCRSLGRMRNSAH